MSCTDILCLPPTKLAHIVFLKSFTVTLHFKTDLR